MIINASWSNGSRTKLWPTKQENNASQGNSKNSNWKGIPKQTQKVKKKPSFKVGFWWRESKREVIISWAEIETNKKRRPLKVFVLCWWWFDCCCWVAMRGRGFRGYERRIACRAAWNRTSESCVLCFVFVQLRLETGWLQRAKAGTFGHRCQGPVCQNTVAVKSTKSHNFKCGYYLYR